MPKRAETPAEAFCSHILNRLHADGVKRSDHLLLFENQTGIGDLKDWPDDRTDGVWIDLIETVRRGEGVGRRLMASICALADECGTTLLNPCAMSKHGLDQQQLEAWYARLGFTTFQHRIMKRIPRAGEARLAA